MLYRPSQSILISIVKPKLGPVVDAALREHCNWPGALFFSSKLKRLVNSKQTKLLQIIFL